MQLGELTYTQLHQAVEVIDKRNAEIRKANQKQGAG